MSVHGFGERFGLGRGREGAAPLPDHLRGMNASTADLAVLKDTWEGLDPGTKGAFLDHIIRESGLALPHMAPEKKWAIFEMFEEVGREREFLGAAGAGARGWIRDQDLLCAFEKNKTILKEIMDPLNPEEPAAYRREYLIEPAIEYMMRSSVEGDDLRVAKVLTEAFKNTKAHPRGRDRDVQEYMKNTMLRFLEESITIEPRLAGEILDEPGLAEYLGISGGVAAANEDKIIRSNDVNAIAQRALRAPPAAAAAAAVAAGGAAAAAAAVPVIPELEPFDETPPTEANAKISHEIMAKGSFADIDLGDLSEELGDPEWLTSLVTNFVEAGEGGELGYIKGVLGDRETSDADCLELFKLLISYPIDHSHVNRLLFTRPPVGEGEEPWRAIMHRDTQIARLGVLAHKLGLTPLRNQCERSMLKMMQGDAIGPDATGRMGIISQYIRETSQQVSPEGTTLYEENVRAFSGNRHKPFEMLLYPAIRDDIGQPSVVGIPGVRRDYYSERGEVSPETKDALRHYPLPDSDLAPARFPPDPQRVAFLEGYRTLRSRMLSVPPQASRDLGRKLARSPRPSSTLISAGAMPSAIKGEIEVGGGLNAVSIKPHFYSHPDSAVSQPLFAAPPPAAGFGFGRRVFRGMSSRTAVTQSEHQASGDRGILRYTLGRAIVQTGGSDEAHNRSRDVEGQQDYFLDASSFDGGATVGDVLKNFRQQGNPEVMRELEGSGIALDSRASGWILTTRFDKTALLMFSKMKPEARIAPEGVRTAADAIANTNVVYVSICKGGCDVHEVSLSEAGPAAGPAGGGGGGGVRRFRKPNIYIYDTSGEEKQLKVTLDIEGEMKTTIPKIGDDNSWDVIINAEKHKDSLLVIKDKDKKVPYSFLFWDAFMDGVFDFEDMSRVWYVRGDKVLNFFESVLIEYLTTKEFTDFVNYWATPEFFNDEDYYIISFEKAPGKLTIEPQPDDLTRLFMLFRKASEEEVVVAKENITPRDEDVYGPELSLKAVNIKFPERTGFTVIEWGGMVLD